MASFYIRTQRKCTRRNADSQRVYDYLEANGWSFTEDIGGADLIVISTCAATDTSEAESLYNISQLIRQKSPAAKLIITGCLPAIDPEKIAEFGDFMVVNPRAMEDFDRLLEPRVGIEEIPEHGKIVVPDFTLPTPSPVLRLAGLAKKYLRDPAALPMAFKRRAALKRRKALQALPSYDVRIAKGCLGTCTYCCIRFATGRLESKSQEVILDEIRGGLEKGFDLISLVGVDTGCYGLDIGTNIAELLQLVFAIPGDFRLKVDDFNPQWLVKFYDRLLPVLLENRPRFIEISVPLQSGSNRVLKKMKRPYNIDVVRDTLVDLKQKLPELRVRTHMLVGFPGETQEDYELTRRLVEEFDFADVTVFRYSDRPRTASRQMEGKLPQTLTTARERDLNNTFASK